MVMYQKSEALCLRLIDFSESSQIARLFTREYGILPVIAKGIKRGRQTSANPLGGPLDMLARGQAVFVAGRGGADLATLSGWQVSDHWPLMRNDLRRYYAGALVAEVTMELLAALDPHPSLFDDLVVTLQMFGDAAASGSARVVAAYLKAALQETGYWPVLEHCVLCGGVINSDIVRFVPQAGGVICGNCRASGIAMAVPSLVVVALSRLPRPGAMKNSVPQRPADPQALNLALQILLSHLEGTLDRVIKTRALLGVVCGCGPAISSALEPPAAWTNLKGGFARSVVGGAGEPLHAPREDPA
ncbi:MAG: DNA repair protein RecO [Phycisphaerae bacterium]|nr:DNA repair protein RecO [Phycisphaerae bacterium]